MTAGPALRQDREGGRGSRGPSNGERRDDMNKVEAILGVCRGQQQGLDEFDLEAMRDGNAIRAFRQQFAAERAATRAQMKRKIVRGSIGASGRKGLLSVGG